MLRARLAAGRARATLGARAASTAADHYRVLGVERSASADAIKAAFRAAAKRYHPDVRGDADAELFKRVNEAYSVLSEECAGGARERWRVRERARARAYSNGAPLPSLPPRLRRGQL